MHVQVEFFSYVTISLTTTECIYVENRFGKLVNGCSLQRTNVGINTFDYEQKEQQIPRATRHLLYALQ